MKIIRTRRQFLRGAGGFTLGLPALTSLLTRNAYGAPIFVSPPRFLAMTTEHGGISIPNMFPAAQGTPQIVSAVPGHDVQRYPLKRVVEGADAYLSPVLRAAATSLTDALVAKMNVMHGLDIPFYINHHTGGHLGNFARHDGTTDVNQFVPTIDQVMAWSPSFYPNLSGIKERALVTGNESRLSWNYSNPSGKSGAVQEVKAITEPSELFDRAIGMLPAPTEQPRPVADLVLESYKRLRDGNRRLSTEDRHRLDDHMGRISELQRRVSVGRSCGTVTKPPTRLYPTRENDPAQAQRFFAALNDVIAATIICGTSRIAVMRVANPFSTYAGDWHQDIAHKHKDPGPQQTLVTALRLVFETVFLDLARKLDVEETPGATYLDGSLLMWSQESGNVTHDSNAIPVVTAGSARGFFATGGYMDYRNHVPGSRVDFNYNPNPELFAGFPYSRWLATVLISMGVPPTEFERNGQGGYGLPFGYGLAAEGADRYKGKYLSADLAALSTVLPFLKV